MFTESINKCAATAERVVATMPGTRCIAKESPQTITVGFSLLWQADLGLNGVSYTQACEKPSLPRRRWA